MKKTKLLLVLVIALLLTTACESSTKTSDATNKKEQNVAKEQKEEKKEEKVDLTGIYFGVGESTGNIDYGKYIILNEDNTLTLQDVECGAAWTSEGHYTINNDKLKIILDAAGTEYNFTIKGESIFPVSDKDKRICGGCGEFYGEFVKGNIGDKKDVIFPTYRPNPEDSMW